MSHKNDKLCILTGDDVGKIISGKENRIIEIIRDAYISHQKGDSTLPHSTFLRFPDKAKDRIIGLPAYIQGAAGIKWIASFPENVKHGIDRASAAIILNSLETGRPYGILEGSIISAKRTAASAALAAKVLAGNRTIEDVSLIGCGLINFEILKFLVSQFKNIKAVNIFDLDTEKAKKFLSKTVEIVDADVRICDSAAEAYGSSKLVSFATTASVPHVNDTDLFRGDAIILHLSLRDLGVGIIKNSINVVDDLDHVNREHTSIHLASQETGATNFVTTSLGELLLGVKQAPESGKPVIFSPFGLGVLDIQLARFVYEEAAKEGMGTVVKDFIPSSWLERPY